MVSTPRTGRVAGHFEQETKELRDWRLFARQEAEMPGMGSGLGSRMNGREA